MKMLRLSITNFRLTEQASYEFGSNLTVVTGANGKGKTNLIDAIHYLCLSRSYFHPHDERLLRFGAPYLSVEGQYDRSGTSIRVHGAWRPGEKVFGCDGKPYDRLSDHVGRFPAVMIAPVDINLIHEGGEQRRRIMDLTLSQEDPGYLQALGRYNRLLRQKQSVLRSWAVTGGGDEYLLRVLSEQMQPLNQLIRQRRRQWTDQMSPLFQQNYQIISGGNECPSLHYQTGWPDESEMYPGDPRAIPITPDRILQQEKLKGRCLWGVHRDDLQFGLDGHPLRPHASQGQQKTFVVSLKLAQSELIRQATGIRPILLLDDVFEKLDEQRVGALIERVTADPDQQILLTHTEQVRVRSILRENQVADYIAL